MAMSRSEQMRRIRSADTGPERAFRSALWAAGLRYRLRVLTPVGRPDLVFPGQRVAVFIDGCFWHGCPLHYSRPRSREAFWSAKLKGNVERDARQSAALSALGWRVVRLWEHEVVEALEGAVERVARAVRGEDPDWATQLRVLRVTPLDEGGERRELVRLAAPDRVVQVVEGPRVTAKARKRAEVPRRRPSVATG